MRVKTIKQSGLAISPQKNVYFGKGEILEVGDKGLSEENLKRLVEIKLAVDVSLKEVEPKKEEEVELPGWMEFTDEGDLYDFAMDEYKIKLDKRKSLENMQIQLKKELEAKDG